MEDALADSVAEAGVGVQLNVGEPFDLQTFPQMLGSSEVTLQDGSGIVATGFADVVAHPTTGNVASVLELTEGGVTRTLDQRLGLHLGDSLLTSWGSLTIDDAVSTTTLAGGWSYDSVDGVIIDPGSDPGFVDELAAMLHAPVITGRGFNLGTIFTFIGNIVHMVVNYIVDLFIPYTPPVSCSGPSISTQTCDGVSVACKDNQADACMMLDDIPGVSTAFKQCMKGRCGCGGSRFGRLRIDCDVAGNCGGCAPPPPGRVVLGCSLAGSQSWYCDGAQPRCGCVNTVFHEMSHGCGAPDFNGESYRIGDWFEQEFDQRFPNACVPVHLGE